MDLLNKVVLPIFVFGLLAITPDVAEAQNCAKNPNHPRCDPAPDPEPEPEPDPEPEGPPPTYGWMHQDVGDAFGDGVTGVGSHLVILDNFGGTTFSGNLDGTDQSLTHGEWTSLQSQLVAPGATFTEVNQPSCFIRCRRDNSGVISDHFDSSAVLQVINLSFGLMEPDGTEGVHEPDYTLGFTVWDSLVDEAKNPEGQAVLVKAAGNTNGQDLYSGLSTISPLSTTLYFDALNQLLDDKPNALFVGALDAEGTLASYSAIAGARAQDQYLVVRVDTSLNGGLAGTSFAAPIVSGYAALVGDKHDTFLSLALNPAERVVDRLLDTARTDTINGTYDAALHGRGEACLSCALSPDGIPY